MHPWLTGFAVFALIMGWFAAGMIALGYNKQVQWWLTDPGNKVRLGLWIGTALLAIITLLSPDGWLLSELRTEAIGIALAVIVIDELGRHRDALQRKQEILHQLDSPVHDAALEALRLARRYGWIEDGSLKGTWFHNAHLEGADLQGARLEGAHLLGAHLEGAHLYGAHLERADLEHAHLEGAFLAEAHLEGAYLYGADLEDAYLANAHLGGANLEHANLSNAQIDVTIKMHSFSPSREDIVEEEYIGYTHLKGATYDEYTRWPEDFDPQAHGALMVKSKSFSEQMLAKERFYRQRV